MKTLFDVEPAVLTALVSKATEHHQVVHAVLQKTKEEHAAAVRASQARVEEAERVAKEGDKDLNFLGLARLLRTCTPPPLIEAWLRVHRLEKKVLRTDIRVDTLQKAKTDLAAAKNALIAECGHPVVLREDGYEGSYSNDHDDGRCGRAVCILCGFSAYDDDWKDNNSKLPPMPFRVVARHVNDPGCDIGYDACRKLGLDGHVKAYRELATPQLALERFFGKKRLAKLQKLVESLVAEDAPQPTA